MKQLAILAIFILLLINCYAQNGITGKVISNHNIPISNASISLFTVQDSVLVKTAISNPEGSFQFTAVLPGLYYIICSHLSFNTLHSSAININDEPVQLPVFRLTKIVEDLAQVQVNAVRPLVEVKNGISILNVDRTINATGSNALDLLRKAPGVMVDKDNNLSIQSKNGVQVYVDGKKLPISGEDLSNYLMSLQSSEIDLFEIITQPSAKYDAAGNAGIINIRLKKNKAFGTNGSATLGFNRGKYNKYNGTVNINNRTKWANIFASYHYGNSKNFNDMNFYRELSDSSFSQYSTINTKVYTHHYKVGADVMLSKKSSLGFVIDGNISDINFKNEGPIHIKYMPTGVLERIVEAANTRNTNRNNVNLNLNYNYHNAKKQSLSIDVDRNYFNFKNDQYQPNIYFDAVADTLLFKNIYEIISPSEITLYSSKIDYAQPLQKGEFLAGIKLAQVKSKNNYQRYRVNNNVPVIEQDKSNLFNYNENISAAYVSFSYPFKNISLQAGLRTEYTQSKSRSIGQTYVSGSNSYVPYDSLNKNNYIDFFPSLSADIKIDEKNNLNVSYSRRIDRPAYQDLNPFEFRLSDYIYLKGNTKLRPQYSNSLSLNYRFWQKLSTSFSYTHVKDIFAQLPDTTDFSKSFLIKKNLATQDVLSLSLNYPFSKKWYSLNVHVNGNYNLYKADFGGGTRVIHLGGFSYVVNLQQSFRLGNDFTAELSALYHAPSIWQGTYSMKSFIGVDAGLQKHLFHNRATVKISVSDIFNTMFWSGKTNFAGSFNEASGHWESRQLRTSFVYRFGNRLVKAQRDRNTSSEAETKRANSAGGLGGM